MLNSVQEGHGFCSNNPLKKAISFGEWSGQPVLTNGKCPEIRSGTTLTGLTSLTGFVVVLRSMNCWLETKRSHSLDNSWFKRNKPSYLSIVDDLLFWFRFTGSWHTNCHINVDESKVTLYCMQNNFLLFLHHLHITFGAGLVCFLSVPALPFSGIT